MSTPWFEDKWETDPETGEEVWTPYMLAGPPAPGYPGPVRFGHWPGVFENGKQIGPVPGPARYRHACSAVTALSPQRPLHREAVHLAKHGLRDLDAEPERVDGRLRFGDRRLPWLRGHEVVVGHHHT